MRTLLTLVILALAAWGLLRTFEMLRPGARPWTPDDFAAPLGRATAWKLASARGDPAWCRRVLKLDGVAFAAVSDRVTAPGCGWAGAVRLTGPAWSPAGPTMTCPVAVAATVWQRAVVRPAARRHLASNFNGFDHYGTYSCRPIAGSSRPSEHSTANAVDIAGFRTIRGRAVSVARDWTPGAPGTTPARAAFLREVHDGACKVFATTLGPSYNKAHRDHFHLDMADRGNDGWRYCP